MRLAPLVLLLVLALPTVASARPHVTSDGTKVLVKDNEEASTVRTDVDLGAGTVRVTAQPEGTAELTAGTGCTLAEPPSVATCDLAGVTAIRLEMGDGADDVWPGDGSLRREILGEGGDDELGDSPGDDLVDGGPGDDRFDMGWGNDEVIGGLDEDTVSWNGRYDAVEAVLPDAGTSSGNGSGGDHPDAENDVLHADIENLHGSQLADRLVGNGGPNRIDGWLENDTLEGMGGADTLVDDRGADAFDGGAGADFLDTSNDGPDTAVDCGEGADRLDADTLANVPWNPFEADPEPIGCETIAPEFIDGPDALIAVDQFRVGHFIHPEEFSVTGDEASDPPEIDVHWHRCDGHEIPRECSLWEGDLVYELQPADAGHVMKAIVTVRNAAGESYWHTDDTPVIAPGVPRKQDDPLPPPPLPPPPPNLFVLPPPPPPDYRDPFPVDYVDPLVALEESVAARLKSLGKRFGKVDPRTFAKASSIGHPFAFPASGTVTMTWRAEVPSAGPRAAALRRVVLAKGSADGPKGTSRSVAVRPTKRGRAVLRRSRRLQVTLTARFVGGVATKRAPAIALQRFTLRRRP